MAEQTVPNTAYRIAFSDDERAALIWALEVSRAILVIDPNLHVLLAYDTVTPRILDDLADRLVAARDASHTETDKPAG